MTTAELAALIIALADWAWPLFAVFVFLCLRRVGIEALRSRAVKIRVGKIEISVQDATDQLARRMDDLELATDRLRPNGPREERERKPVKQRPILAWVDDVPENNAYEIRHLEENGVRVLTSTSTHGALRTLIDEGAAVDVVVSDMGRQEGKLYNPDAGLDLIRLLRDSDFNAPIYVYCSPISQERTQDEVIRAKGSGITASRIELFGFLRKEGLLRW